MLRLLHQTRLALACSLALVTFSWLWQRYPFPDAGQNAILDTMYFRACTAYYTLAGAWALVLFGVPLLYVFYPLLANLRRVQPAARQPRLGALPPYPDPFTRRKLSLVLGEIHDREKLEPAERPDWLEIPDEGLVLGLVAMGGPGTGKSQGVMLPAAAQLFAFRASDSAQRLGGLVLEVKGDFCEQVRRVLQICGRQEDYLELGLDSNYCYNPLHNQNSPTALAFNIIALMKTLHGESKEPFWEQAAQSLVTFLIVVYRLLHDYVTLFDIYQAASDLSIVDALMAKAALSLEATNVLLDKHLFVELPADLAQFLNQYTWTNAPPHHMRTPADRELSASLRRRTRLTYFSEKYAWLTSCQPFSSTISVPVLTAG